MAKILSLKTYRDHSHCKQCRTRTCLGKLINSETVKNAWKSFHLVDWVDCLKHPEWRWVRAALFKPQHLGSETRPDDPSVIDGANPTARAHFLLLKTTGALLRMSPSHIKAANSTQASHMHAHTRSRPSFSIGTQCWSKTREHYRSSWHKSIFLILIHLLFKTRAVVGSCSARPHWD